MFYLETRYTRWNPERRQYECTPRPRPIFAALSPAVAYAAAQATPEKMSHLISQAEPFALVDTDGTMYLISEPPQ